MSEADHNASALGCRCPLPPAAAPGPPRLSGAPAFRSRGCRCAAVCAGNAWFYCRDIFPVMRVARGSSDSNRMNVPCSSQKRLAGPTTAAAAAAVAGAHVVVRNVGQLGLPRRLLQREQLQARVGPVCGPRREGEPTGEARKSDGWEVATCLPPPNFPNSPLRFLHTTASAPRPPLTRLIGAGDVGDLHPLPLLLGHERVQDAPRVADEAHLLAPVARHHHGAPPGAAAQLVRRAAQQVPVCGAGQVGAEREGLGKRGCEGARHALPQPAVADERRQV